MSKFINIFGIHASHSILRSRPEDVIKVYFDRASNSQRISELIDVSRSLGLNVDFVETKVIDRIVGDEIHQGVCLTTRPKKLLPIDYFSDNFNDLSSDFLMLVLDQIQDPHNLGACLRTALAFNVDAVLLTRDRSAGLTSIVSKVSCGADQQLAIYDATNLSRSISLLKKQGIWFYGADQKATKVISDVIVDRPTAIVMGSEGNGLRRLTLEAMDELVVIPISNSIESLNVSVATGICLHSLRVRK
jgi:23S rRNA (guanosine2251-2'-O)-methyltransferase